MAAFDPTVKRVYVCDDVVRNPDLGKPMIVNLWETVRVPPESAFPYRLDKLCLFVWFREGLGTVRFRIEIVYAGTTEAIAIPFEFSQIFRDPNRSVFGKFMLRGVTFPEPELYTVDFYCNDELVDYHMITVTEDEA